MNNPYFLLILAPLIWGGNAVAGKLAVGEIAPMTLVFLRWAVALLVLLPIALPHVKKDWSLLKPALGWMVLYGVVGFALFNIIFYVAANYTTAINIALIQASIPMLILLMNRLFYRQPLVMVQMLGLVMAFIGVVLIVTGGDWKLLMRFDFNIGDMLMLVAALFYAIYSVGLRHRPAVSWLSFIFVAAFFAFLTSIPFAAYELLTMQTAIFHFSITSLLLLIYIGVFASIISQIAYAKGVGLIGANRASFSINLVPVFGVMLAVVILDETLQWYHLLGLVLVLGGIALSERLTGGAK